MRRPAALLISLLLVAACSASTTGSPSEPGSVAPSAPASAASSGPPTAELADRTELELNIQDADFPFVAFDSVWVVSDEPGAPGMVRVDPFSNGILADIDVPAGGGSSGAVAGFDSIWASSAGVARIDPATNAVQTIVESDTYGHGKLAVGAGSVWAFTRQGDRTDPDTLLRIDPETNTPSGTIPLDRVLGQMAFGFDGLWVTAPNDGQLLKVDPATGAAAVVASGLTGPFAVVVTDDSVWVSLFGVEGQGPAEGEATIAQIDPASGAVLATFVTDPIDRSGYFALDGTSLWVRTSNTFLTEFDSATGDVLQTITASAGGGDLIVGFDSVWATSWDFHKLWRVSPD